MLNNVNSRNLYQKKQDYINHLETKTIDHTKKVSSDNLKVYSLSNKFSTRYGTVLKHNTKSELVTMNTTPVVDRNIYQNNLFVNE